MICVDIVGMEMHTSMCVRVLVGVWGWGGEYGLRLTLAIPESYQTGTLLIEVESLPSSLLWLSGFFGLSDATLSHCTGSH